MPPSLRTSYAEAFERTLCVSPHSATLEELATAVEKFEVVLPEGMDRHDRDEWLNLLLAMRIEPELGRDRPEIIYHYPATQASLAKVVPSNGGHEVAERFELYHCGIELANGFHELGDATELRKRFEAVNVARVADGRRALPLPERLLNALEVGLPDCTGVALGFDRLAMLAIGATSIDDVVAFPEDRA
jgi:lysyl-tRNA synthetase class 2